MRGQQVDGTVRSGSATNTSHNTNLCPAFSTLLLHPAFHAFSALPCFPSRIFEVFALKKDESGGSKYFILVLMDW
jgi:hypothetical protein